MKPVILNFVNLSRQDAFLSVGDSTGEPQSVGKILPGEVSRQATVEGLTWTVVGSDSYQITAADKNRVYIIGSQGVYEVQNARALTAESGAPPVDFDFPVGGSGGWP